MSATGIQALLDVSLSYINEARDSAKTSLLMGITNNTDCPTKNLTADETKIISETLIELFNNRISLAQACQIINPIVGTQHPMQRIAGILSITDEPIPTNQQDYPDNLSRHKTRPWMLYEDQRLLAAILRYGFENWVMIAEFVGNGRTRSQCSQRWNRGLNPKISKGTWSKEEEEKLLRLVSENGDKSWTKISMEFGNRSDVQCRYRYQQLLKDNQTNSTTISSASNEINTEDNANFDEKECLNIERSPIAQNIPAETNIQVDENKFKNETKTQTSSIITLQNQLQNPINAQIELPKLSSQQFLQMPTSINNPSFSQQENLQNKDKLQQESSTLPKISLPKIDPSIFMEC